MRSVGSLAVAGGPLVGGGDVRVLPTVFVAFLYRHLGADLMGSMFILPVIIYGEQAIFFAGGHALGTMFGVRGNIALASIHARPASWA